MRGGLTCSFKLGVALSPFEASNVGWRCSWSQMFQDRFAGHPLKNIALIANGGVRRGEMMITAYGLEGGPLYALRAEIEAADGRCAVDLAPDRSISTLARALERPAGKASLSNWLRKRTGLEPAKIGLLREAGPLPGGAELAARLKACPLTLSGKRPIEEAISSAGGVASDAIDERLMLRAAPGIFCAGEMTDWDAPTGGWLLNGCIAMGRAAGAAAAQRVGCG